MMPPLGAGTLIKRCCCAVVCNCCVYTGARFEMLLPKAGTRCKRVVRCCLKLLCLRWRPLRDAHSKSGYQSKRCCCAVICNCFAYAGARFEMLIPGAGTRSKRCCCVVDCNCYAYEGARYEMLIQGAGARSKQFRPEVKGGYIRIFRDTFPGDSRCLEIAVVVDVIIASYLLLS